MVIAVPHMLEFGKAGRVGRSHHFPEKKREPKALRFDDLHEGKWLESRKKVEIR
jgi:hypothetical protein